MSKLITFPNGLWDTQNWLFNMYGVTAEKNSDGGTGTSAPQANKFQVERGRSHITTSGVPVVRGESGCLEMKYAQSISNHYYMTSYCGWAVQNSSNASNINHSPLYDPICNKLSFSWKKYDDAVKDGRTNNRFRMVKIGMSFRSSSGGGYLKDLSAISGSYSNLFSFNTNSSASNGITSGTCTMSVPANSCPFGMYFQLETEGSGSRYPNGSYIRIWNLRFYSSKSDEALMLPYQAYSSATPPTNTPLWTT